MPDKTKKKRRVRFRKGRVVYRKGDIHPRCMIGKRHRNHETKIVNAKLHLYKKGDEERKDVILFSRNPNPDFKEIPGAFYKSLKNDRRENLVYDSSLMTWEVPKDGIDKMVVRMKEKEAEEIQQEKRRKENKKKKQAYQSGALKPRLPRLCKHMCRHIESFFRRKFKGRKKGKPTSKDEQQTHERRKHTMCAAAKAGKGRKQAVRRAVKARPRKTIGKRHSAPGRPKKAIRAGKGR